MDNVLDLGIAVILFLQSLGDWLIAPMQFFSFLGYEEFFLLIAPGIYWSLNAQLGLRVGLFLMISGNINSFLKLAGLGPRPYWYDARVRALSAETSFGIPSGHAQHAVVVWGTLARHFKRGWAWALAIAIMLLIGVSRLYLGMHFLTDVLAGWLIGAVLLWLFPYLERFALYWIKGKSSGEQGLGILGVSLAMVLIGALLKLNLGDWTFPSEWMNLATKAVPDVLPDPLALSGFLTNSGAFFGLAWGGILIQKQGGYNAEGPLWQRVGRFFVGLVGVLILWNGLGMIFPRGENLIAYALRFIRYGLVGLWVVYLAPLAFYRLRLATPPGTAKRAASTATTTASSL